MFIKLYDDNPQQREMDKIVEVLRNGGIIIYPTDTLYGIGCDALNVRAVERICQIKGLEPQKNHLSIICSDISDVSEYARMSNAVFKLMRRNLPGPFTFILPTTSVLPRVFRNRKTVGVRVPDRNIIRELVRLLGNPILTTSIKDEDDEIEYTTNPELIYEKWGERVDLVIDGGYGGTIGSTVIDCTSDVFEIIRYGAGDLQQ